MTDKWLTLPNVITLFRLALVPVFLGFHLTGHAHWALACFVVAAISDSIDGFLARVLNQRSKLGGVLDPIADKLLVSAALISLVWSRQLPIWLLGLIAFRDGAMIIGAFVVKRKHLEIPTAPTRIGKYATFTMICLVVMALWAQEYASVTFRAYTMAVGFIAALFVVVSTVQYFARFGYLFFVPARSTK